MKSTFAAILRLAPTGLLAGLFAIALVSSASNAYAAGDGYGSFNESGRYNYHGYAPGSSLRPSIGQPGYEENRRARESFDAEANRWRQEALRQERESSSNSAKPIDPNPYNFPEAVYGPNGRMMLCTKGFTATYCN